MSSTRLKDRNLDDRTDNNDSHNSNDSGKESKPSLFERFGLSGRQLQIANWIAVAVCIYFLITAVSVIGDGFQASVGDQAEELFSFASNPLVALMIGMLATALIQSSTTTTSIVVGLVAGGLPMSIAIPMLMGANMGTSLTSTLVSLGMVRDKKSFRGAFGAATTHDMYNLLSVLILFPVEVLTGYLSRASEWLSTRLSDTDGGIFATVFNAIGNAISFVTDPLADQVAKLGDILPTPWGGLLLIVIGVAVILLVINALGNLLQAVLVGRAKEILHTSMGRGPVSGIASGTLVTAMVQSSTTTTSLLVPLAGAGTITLKQVLPFTVGANIGTTFTAILAAFGFSGIDAQAALQAALVHLLYNLTAAAIIFLIPGMRRVPTWAAGTLAKAGAENKLWVIAWIVGVFLVIPGLLIGATLLL